MMSASCSLFWGSSLVVVGLGFFFFFLTDHYFDVENGKFLKKK